MAPPTTLTTRQKFLRHLMQSAELAFCEGRRERLQTKLLRKDEGALFMIANQFDLRHQNEQ